VDWQALHQRIVAALAEARGQTAGRLQPLADVAAQSRQQAAGMALAWLQGPDALELAEALVDFVSTVPIRRKHMARAGRPAPAGLSEAAEALAQAQAKYSAHDPKSWRGARRAALRCRAWLDLLGTGGLDRANPGEAAALAADLDRLVDGLDTLRRMEAADARLGEFLERWAVRQARRKAPQLHGAEAVLALRQSVRRERQQQQRSLVDAWRPVRGRLMRQRVNRLVRAAAAGRTRA
jgi:hypothetical protein